MGSAAKACIRGLVRYRQEGIAGLEDRSHQVHHHPWRIPAEVEGLICELRRAHPKWGPRRLVFEMGRRGHQVTRSASTAPWSATAWSSRSRGGAGARITAAGKAAHRWNCGSST